MEKKVVTLPFRYKQYWRPSKRHRKQLWYNVEETAQVEVLAPEKENDFPIAAKRYDYKWDDNGKMIEFVDEVYRYYDNRLWKKGSAPKVKSSHEYGESTPGEDNTEIVLDRDEREQKYYELLSDAAKVIYFESSYWREAGEPVMRIYWDRGWGSDVGRYNAREMDFYDDKICFSHSIYNLADVDWKRDDCHYLERFDVLIPEAFKYGRDLNIVKEYIEYDARHIWMKIFEGPYDEHYNRTMLAEKTLETIMPEVIEKVLATGKHPYQYEEDEVKAAMAEVLDERIGV